jgi:hypothetical protein
MKTLTILCLAPTAALALACGTSSSGTSTQDSGSPDVKTDATTPADAAMDASHDAAKDASQDAPSPTTTIAAARKGNVTTPIIVKAFVTALAGVPKDYPNWYVEDPAGGPYSGVNVYCDPLVTTPCTVPEPALHDLIVVSGSLTTYKGQVELIPTAMTVLQSNATFPHIDTLMAADIAPSADSPYRGVFVKLAISSKLIVDDVTPTPLFDTECGTPPPGDAGADAGDAGLPSCSPKCEPPVYSGFRANDGTGDEVYIEAPFFNTDPLQSSPECLTQPGVVPVTDGMTFSSMQGVLDLDPYAKAQALSPVQPSDYVTP